MHAATGDLIVGRAWSWTQEALARDVERDRVVKVAAGSSDMRPTVSVFALARLPDEEIDQTIARLEAHILKYRRSKYLAVTTQAELSAGGFEIELNEPPPHHYDVVLGEIKSDQAIVALNAMFDKRERRRIAS